MKKMTRLTHKYPGQGYYKITPCEGYYIITIASDRANVMISYEYDAACGTLEEVEAELREHTFNEIRKLYKEQCVYCECVEQIS